MRKKFNKIFRVYIFDKNFTVCNAGGFPPDYMFSGKDPIGSRCDLYGNSEEEVLEFVNSCLSDVEKEIFEIKIKFLEDTPEKVIEE